MPEEPPFNENDFPTEEPIFDYVEPPEELFEKPKAALKKEKTQIKEIAGNPIPEGATAETVFGKFMRSLRKAGASGVLFTMCSDLEFFFEGKILVLTTQSKTVFSMLQKEEHTKIIKTVFENLGVPYEVRLKVSEPDYKCGTEELERNFSDYVVEIKEK